MYFYISLSSYLYQCVYLLNYILCFSPAMPDSTLWSPACGLPSPLSLSTLYLTPPCGPHLHSPPPPLCLTPPCGLHLLYASLHPVVSTSSMPHSTRCLQFLYASLQPVVSTSTIPHSCLWSLSTSNMPHSTLWSPPPLSLTPPCVLHLHYPSLHHVVSTPRASSAQASPSRSSSSSDRST